MTRAPSRSWAGWGWEVIRSQWNYSCYYTEVCSRYIITRGNFSERVRAVRGCQEEECRVVRTDGACGESQRKGALLSLASSYSSPRSHLSISQAYSPSWGFVTALWWGQGDITSLTCTVSIAPSGVVHAPVSPIHLPILVSIYFSKCRPLPARHRQSMQVYWIGTVTWLFSI